MRGVMTALIACAISTGSQVDQRATDGAFDQNSWYTLGGGTPFRVKGREDLQVHAPALRNLKPASPLVQFGRFFWPS